jgi:very-short-patch-repair endonuclease
VPRPFRSTVRTGGEARVRQTEAQILLGIHLAELKFFASAEFQFCERSWRFDWANRDRKIAFECNGGKWSGGHRHGAAIEDENEKINTAQMMGWKVLQFTNQEILTGRAKEFLRPWLEGK